MKTIEKENGQIFEIYTSNKEFAKLVKDITGDTTWNDDDSSLTLIYKDGSCECYFLGDTIKPLRLREVVKGCWSNSCTNAIYNCEIIHNEHYEDYEVRI